MMMSRRGLLPSCSGKPVPSLSRAGSFANFWRLCLGLPSLTGSALMHGEVLSGAASNKALAGCSLLPADVDELVAEDGPAMRKLPLRCCCQAHCLQVQHLQHSQRYL